MDNVSCSHRCTSYVRLWSGARSVFTAPARPAFLFLLTFFPVPSCLFRPSIRDLWEKFPNSLNVLLVPKANFDPTYQLNLWGGHLLC